MRKARVFISCGQRSSGEKSIGMAVEKYFRDRGFDAYFAERVHSSEGLTDHIFRFLQSSEYFVFIDFRRDALDDKSFRGSVFVNQEIALATFLKLQGLGFMERGVRREGVLDYQIWNPIEFEGQSDILSRLSQETSAWDPDSVNELFIDYDRSKVSWSVTISNNSNKPLSDWHHLTVKNRSKIKHAFSCSGFLASILDLGGGEGIPVPTVEMIWSGFGAHEANIIADGERELDAFYVMHRENDIRFNQRSPLTTEKRFWMPTLKQGTYLLTYSIISDNFLPVSRSFKVIHRGLSKEVKVEPQD